MKELNNVPIKTVGDSWVAVKDVGKAEDANAIQYNIVRVDVNRRPNSRSWNRAEIPTPSQSSTGFESYWVISTTSRNSFLPLCFSISPSLSRKLSKLCFTKG